ASRVATLIARHFHQKYHPEHVRKILKSRLNWTSQKPQLRAKEQNDKEVERWLDDAFRRIIREAWQRDATLVFLDEARFMLTPTVRRTLAPRGKTPVLPTLARHDRIRAISCVTLGIKAEQPELYFELMPAGLNVTAENIVAFLDDLRRELPGALTGIWDRHNIHSRSRLVKAWLGRPEGVGVGDLPAYAAAPNPHGMGWASPE